MQFEPSKNFRAYQQLTSEEDQTTFLKQLLPSYKLSASHLNTYLRCSNTFLYECLLKVKFPSSESALIGSAYHYALEQAFAHKKQFGVFAQAKEIESAFLSFVTKETQKQGTPINEKFVETEKENLLKYYELHAESWNTIAVCEFFVPKLVWNGVPLTGFLDKIEFNGKQVNIVDYKSGNFERGRDAFLNEGDYYRQLMFYSLLVDEYPKSWTTESVEIALLKPNDLGEFKSYKKRISDQEKAQIRALISETYQKISALEFSSCGREDCFWCNQINC